MFTLTTGCSNSINVKGNFPKPVIAPIPISSIGVYSEKLSTFYYQEEEKNRDKWKIKAGKAHISLFNTVFSGMFSSFEYVMSDWPLKKPAGDSSDPDKSNDPSKSNSTTNLYIVPRIKDFQYSSPKETRLNVYEVWFKYNIKVYDNKKELIADWIMSSYGKTPSAILKSKDKAMEQAVIMSLRDLGASLSLGFQRVPEVRDWLAANPVASVHVRQEPKK